MKVGDKVRAGFDHMVVSASTISVGFVFGEVGTIIGVSVKDDVYPIIVEFSVQRIPSVYKYYVTCNNVSFKECELVLCN